MKHIINPNKAQVENIVKFLTDPDTFGHPADCAPGTHYWCVPVQWQALKECLDRNEALRANKRTKQSALNINYFRHLIKNKEFSVDLPNNAMLIGTQTGTKGCILDAGHRARASVAEQKDVLWNLEFLTPLRESLVSKYTDSNFIRSLSIRTGLSKKYVEIVSYRMLKARGGRLSPEDALKYYKAHKVSIDWASRTVGSKKDAHGLTRAPALAAFTEMYEMYAEQAVIFGHAVAKNDFGVPQAAALIHKLGILTSKSYAPQGAEHPNVKATTDTGDKVVVGGGTQVSQLVYGITVYFCRAFIEGIKPNGNFAMSVAWDSPTPLPLRLPRVFKAKSAVVEA